MCASGVNAAIMHVIGKLEQKKNCAIGIARIGGFTLSNNLIDMLTILNTQIDILLTISNKQIDMLLTISTNKLRCFYPYPTIKLTCC